MRYTWDDLAQPWKPAGRMGKRAGRWFGGGGGEDNVDISGELAKLSAMYDEISKKHETRVAAGLGRMNTAAASNAAARGTYTSPVSEWTYGRNREIAADALAQGQAEIASQEAQARGNLMRALLGHQLDERAEARKRARSRKGAILGLLAGGTAAFLSGGNPLASSAGFQAGSSFGEAF